MGGNYIYQHGKNVLYFFYNIAPKKIYETTSMDERREIFRVYIELCYPYQDLHIAFVNNIKLPLQLSYFRRRQ